LASRTTVRTIGLNGAMAIDEGSADANLVLSDLSRRFVVPGLRADVRSQTFVEVLMRDARRETVMTRIETSGDSIWLRDEGNDKLIRIGDNVKLNGIEGRVLSAKAGSLLLEDVKGTRHLVETKKGSGS
jgi:hypothetical protein